MNARATVSPSADWLERLCGWVRRAQGDLGPLAWPVLLMPQRIGSQSPFPADARTVYQRLRWRAPLPDGALDLDAHSAWVAPHGEGTDIAIACSASSSGAQVADSEVVVRTKETVAGWGVADVPPVPKIGELHRRLSFALSEHDVAAFAELTEVHEPIHEDPVYAWRLGLPNALVQELTLLLIVMHVAPATRAGSVEMWFAGPVPVGSLLTLWQDADTWEVRLAGTGRIAAVGQIVTGVGQMADAQFATSKG